MRIFRYAVLITVLVVLFGSATGNANLAMAPTSASQTIASINLSSTTFVPGGTATVGTISATMSPSSPSFTGAFTLGTGSGCAGTDNATFSICGGTTLLTTNGAGSYSLGLVATQAGISNSPFCHEFAITGTSAFQGPLDIATTASYCLSTRACTAAAAAAGAEAMVIQRSTDSTNCTVSYQADGNLSC